MIARPAPAVDRAHDPAHLVKGVLGPICPVWSAYKTAANSLPEFVNVSQSCVRRHLPGAGVVTRSAIFLLALTAALVRATSTLPHRHGSGSRTSRRACAGVGLRCHRTGSTHGSGSAHPYNAPPRTSNGVAMRFSPNPVGRRGRRPPMRHAPGWSGARSRRQGAASARSAPGTGPVRPPRHGSPTPGLGRHVGGER
jgi:hypothetical protein